MRLEPLRCNRTGEIATWISRCAGPGNPVVIDNPVVRPSKLVQPAGASTLAVAPRPSRISL